MMPQTNICGGFVLGNRASRQRERCMCRYGINPKNISLNNSILERVKNCKYIGSILDSKIFLTHLCEKLNV